MKLGELLKELEYTYVSGKLMEEALQAEVTDLCYDSRKLKAGCAYVAISGARFDGHQCAQQASDMGAAVIITGHEVECSGDSTVIRVADTRYALSLLSAAWFGYPARKLTTIAITGTKGKSTTAYMVRNILEAAGLKTGIMGTIGVGIGDKVYATNNTTPESFIVQQYLARMVEEDCKCLVMEVSSQAMKMNRVAGIIYDYAIFTNLEPDHIGENEHASFEEYMYCKSLLFKQCRLAFGNTDDMHFDGVLGDACCTVEGFGLEKKFATPVQLAAENIRLTSKPGELGICYDAVLREQADAEKGRLIGSIQLSIPGSFNVYNSLAALAVARHILGDDAFTPQAPAVTALKNTHVKGRLEPINISRRFSLMIDYAHNAMALESLLKTLKEYSPARLVCLFGCGGNRSKDRRFEMGEVSSRLADLTVVTSDNPRFEKPMDIIADILVGVKRANGEYVMIPDRKDAIRYVIENAEEGDLIILAGKGQEDYQEIEGVKYHLDEREVVAEVVTQLEKEGKTV